MPVRGPGRGTFVKKGDEVFYPRQTVLGRRRDRKKFLRVPLFPGYLFVHNRLETQTYYDILNLPRVVRFWLWVKDCSRWPWIPPPPSCWPWPRTGPTFPAGSCKKANGCGWPRDPSTASSVLSGKPKPAAEQSLSNWNSSIDPWPWNWKTTP